MNYINGLTLLNQGKYGEASQRLEQDMKRGFCSASRYATLAICYEIMGEQQKADDWGTVGFCLYKK